MNNLTVSFYLKKDGRLIYIEDRVSDVIMNTATSIFEVRSLYCEEKGYKSRELVQWQILEPEPESEEDLED